MTAERSRDFELAMGRLKEVTNFFGLLADRYDIQTAALLERILKDCTALARLDFDGLATVMTLAMKLASHAQDRADDVTIMHHLLTAVGGKASFTHEEMTARGDVMKHTDLNGDMSVMAMARVNLR